MTQAQAQHADPVAAMKSSLARAVYEAGMAALALSVVALLLWNPPWQEGANLLLWGLFVLDYGTRLALSKDRRAFVRGNLVDLIAIMPFDLLRAARSLRALRLLRLLRVGTVLWRVSASVRGVLTTNGLAWVLAVAGLVVVGASLAIREVEPALGTFADALWWSVVTATTVGYGDFSPAGAPGRLIAVGLMLVGIGTIGMVTGSIATYFTRPDRDARARDPYLTALADQVRDWAALTAQERARVITVLTALQTAGEDTIEGRAARTSG